MKNNNKAYMIVPMVIVCLILGLALFSCKDRNTATPVYAWEKTFGFTGEMNDFNDTYIENDGVKGTGFETLLKQEFEKGNLDLSGTTINGEETDAFLSVTSADELVAEMKTLALRMFTERFENINIAVDTKSSLTVRINDIQYSLVLIGKDIYALLSADTKQIIGSLSPELMNAVNGIEFEKNCLKVSLKGSNISINVPTKTVIDDISAYAEKDKATGVIIRTWIPLSYTAYFSEIIDG